MTVLTAGAIAARGVELAKNAGVDTLE